MGWNHMTPEQREAVRIKAAEKAAESRRFEERRQEHVRQINALFDEIDSYWTRESIELYIEHIRAQLNAPRVLRWSGDK